MENYQLPLAIAPDGKLLYAQDLSQASDGPPNPSEADKRRLLEARWRQGEWRDLMAGGTVIGLEQALTELKQGTPLGKCLLEIGWNACTLHRSQVLQAAYRQPPEPALQGEPFPLPEVRTPPRRTDANGSCKVTIHNSYPHQVLLVGFCDIPGNGAKQFDLMENQRYYVWDGYIGSYVACIGTLPGLTDVYIDKDTLDFPSGAALEYSESITLEIHNHLNTCVQLFGRERDGQLGLLQQLWPNQGIVISGLSDNLSVAAITHEGKLVSQHYCCAPPDTHKSLWEIEPECLSVYGVDITRGNYLYAPWQGAYQLGTGDFTALVTTCPEGTGALIACKALPGGWGNGGFLLVLEPDNKLRLTTDDGIGYYEAISDSIGALDDGMEHCIAGVRKGADLLLYCDGQQLTTHVHSNRTPPLNISNRNRLTLGYTDQTDPYKTYTGAIYNAGLWSRALSSQEQMTASFEVESTLPRDRLLGYWDLNYRLDDLSSLKVALQVQGSVPYISDFDTEWVRWTDKFYHLCCMNPQNDLLPASQSMTQTLRFQVEAGTPALTLSLRDASACRLISSDRVAVELESPSGVKYGKDSAVSDTEDLFLHKTALGVDSLVLSHPAGGEWKVRIACPVRVPFKLTIQTMPDCATDQVQATILAAMSYLYGAANGDEEALYAYAFQDGFSLMEHVEVSENTGADANALPFFVVRGLAIAKLKLGPILCNPLTWKYAVAAVVVAAAGYGIYKGISYLCKQTPIKAVLVQASQDNTGSTWSQAWFGQSARRQAIRQQAKSSLKNVAQLDGGDDTADKLLPYLKSKDCVYLSISGYGGMEEIYGNDKTQAPILTPTTSVEQGKVFFLYADYATLRHLGVGQALVSKCKAKAVFGFENMVIFAPNSLIFNTHFMPAILRAEEAFLQHDTAGEALLKAYSEYSAQVTALKNANQTIYAGLLQYLQCYFRGPTASDATYGDPDTKI